VGLDPSVSAPGYRLPAQARRVPVVLQCVDQFVRQHPRRALRPRRVLAGAEHDRWAHCKGPRVHRSRRGSGIRPGVQPHICEWAAQPRLEEAARRGVEEGARSLENMQRGGRDEVLRWLGRRNGYLLRGREVRHTQGEMSGSCSRRLFASSTGTIDTY
jgi:hypothetical protein